MEFEFFQDYVLVTRNNIFNQEVSRKFYLPPGKSYNDLLEGYLAWTNGGLIQDVFGWLSAEEREFFLTGLDDSAWDNLLGGEDE
jgi:hypothetical protein